MVRIIIEIFRTSQCLDLLISLVVENILVIWKFVVWVILDIHHLHRFRLLITYALSPFKFSFEYPS